MKDNRNNVLANLIINYSTDLKKGELLYLEMKGKETLELGKEIIRIATEKGASVFWFYNDESIARQWIKSADEDQFKKQTEIHLEIMKKSDAYVALRGSDNPFDLADIPDLQIKRLNNLFYKPVHLEQRLNHTKWVVLRFPNNAMAQLAKTSQEKFEEFYYKVCCMDYQKMSSGLERLVKLMNSTDRVHIIGPGTDLKFSIKGIPAIKCAGKMNIPDGEVYTAPIKDSVNGTIKFNTPALYQGTVYTGISFQLKDGKIVNASADSNSDKINKILDTDEGSRFIGEFALGVNPFVLEPMMDTLFDEKIAGSFHFTPGNSYEDANNGNKSAIHWDLVAIQRPEHGGGEIWFDNKLIRKDGKFTDQDLEKSLSQESLGTD